MQFCKKTIWDYYYQHQRDLPWRKTTDPYKILISEVMLQQTQVSRILQKYPIFIKTFPDFESLAKANLSDVLQVWKGTGYNRRALYLKQLAKIVVEKYNGILPDDLNVLETLPGIGHATASAVITYAFNKPIPFIETNTRRVFIYFFFPDKKSVRDKEIMKIVEKTLDRNNPREWYWALMDYGAMLAKTISNPNRKSTHYTVQSKFEGSNRQLRGRIISYLLEVKSAHKKRLERLFGDNRLNHTLTTLMKEGFVIEKNGEFSIK